MGPPIAAQHRLLNCSDSKGTEQHYRGELKKAQVHANVLWHNAADNQPRAHCALFDSHMELFTTLLHKRSTDQCQRRHNHRADLVVGCSNHIKALVYPVTKRQQTKLICTWKANCNRTSLRLVWWLGQKKK